MLKIANEEGVIGPGWVWLGSDWLHSGWSQGGAIPKEIQEKLVGSIGVSLWHDDVKLDKALEGALRKESYLKRKRPS